MQPDSASVSASGRRLVFPPQRWTVALPSGAKAFVWADSMGRRADAEFEQLIERGGATVLSPVAHLLRGAYVDWSEPAENDHGEVEYTPRAWNDPEDSYDSITFDGECWLTGQSSRVWEVTMVDASVVLVWADAWVLEESAYRFTNAARDASGPVQLAAATIPAASVHAVRKRGNGSEPVPCDGTASR